MILITILIANICVIISSQFKNYIDRFQKKYQQNQYYQREQQFYQKILQIQKFNSKNLGFTMQITNFTDWYPSQISNYLKKRQIPSYNGTLSSLTTQKQTKVGLPPNFDWRDLNKISYAKDQGYCNSGWVFAVTGLFQAIYTMHQIKNIDFLDFAQEFLLDCSEKYIIQDKRLNSCNGGNIYDAMTVAVNGMPLESDLLYVALDPVWNNNNNTPQLLNKSTCKTFSNLVKISSKIQAKIYSNLTNSQLKMLIIQTPVVVQMKVQESFLNYRQGIYQCSQPSTIYNLNHAVLVIGYTTQGNFIIKNSWTQDWGVNGFAIISSKKDKDCGIKYNVGIFNKVKDQKLEKILEYFMICLMIVLLI